MRAQQAVVAAGHELLQLQLVAQAIHALLGKEEPYRFSSPASFSPVGSLTLSGLICLSAISTS